MYSDIANKLSLVELLDQLAEEASELTQACLKLKRAHQGSNPTRNSFDCCINNLLEELADVETCRMAVLTKLSNLQCKAGGTSWYENRIFTMEVKKRRRWEDSLKQGNE